MMEQKKNHIMEKLESKESRSSIHKIIRMAELALESDLAPEGRDYLRAIKSSARSLLTTFNNINKLPKLETQKNLSGSTPFDLNHHIRDFINMQSGETHIKGLEPDYCISVHSHNQMFENPDRMQQNLTNLISDAINFADRGEVVVSVKKENQIHGRNVLHFTVSDTIV
jgi:signal transduction histidine kinase